MLKLGFTGTRKGVTGKQLSAGRVLLATLLPDEFHHGNCIGADEEFAMLVRQRSSWCRLVSHPCHLIQFQASDRHDDEVRETLPPLERNRNIVDECDEIIACPRSSGEGWGGTWYTIEYARMKGKKLTIIYPDGSLGQ